MIEEGLLAVFEITWGVETAEQDAEVEVLRFAQYDKKVAPPLWPI
jgi:hypothetical protein